MLKLQAGARGYLARKQIRLQRQQQADTLVLVQVSTVGEAVKGLARAGQQRRCLERHMLRSTARHSIIPARSNPLCMQERILVGAGPTEHSMAARQRFSYVLTCEGMCEGTIRTANAELGPFALTL